jgi:hypothetical protein
LPQGLGLFSHESSIPCEYLGKKAMVTYLNDHHLSGLSAYFLEFEDGDEMVMSLDDFWH